MPESPVLDEPVPIDRAPLTPFVPALAEPIETVPEDEADPTPLVITIEPPVATEDMPPAREMVPPTSTVASMP
jgi:hypothetical protein